MNDQRRKLAGLYLATIVALATITPLVFTGVSGIAAAANTAGNVSISINSAGNQATVTVDDSDLNTAGNSVQSITVNVESDSEPVTNSTTTSDTADGSNQEIQVARRGYVADRDDSGTTNAADFMLTGASGESISNIRIGSTFVYVTISDSSGSDDGNPETVSYTKLTLQGTGSDTSDNGNTLVSTQHPVGDQNGDGVIDKSDITFSRKASDESIASFSLNPDGTADIVIQDSGSTSDSSETGGASSEILSYVPGETVTLSETGPNTGSFTGSISIAQTDSNGTLKAKDGDTITAIYWDGGTTKRTASQTLSIPTGFINGTVTSNGTAVSGAPVYIVNSSTFSLITSTTTDANGDYNVSVSSPATYDVIVDSNSYQTEFATKKKVRTDQVTTVDFQLTKLPGKGFINGTVVDSNNNPLPNATVFAAESSYTDFGTDNNLNSSGGFSVNVRQGTYTVTVSHPGKFASKQIENVNVTANQTTQLTVTLKQGGFVAGTVTNASGQPAQNALIIVETGSGTQPGRVNRTTGKYNVSVPPGNHTVTVFAQGGTAPSKQVSVSRGQTNKTDFQLRNTTIVHQSVKITSGPGSETNLGIRAGLIAGFMQVQLVNESSFNRPGLGPPSELEGLGVNKSTTFRINITVKNFTANSLLWGLDNAKWSTSNNATVTNGTDITITGSPVTMQVNFDHQDFKNRQEAPLGPLIDTDPSNIQWPTGRNDRATNGRNQTVYIGLFDLGSVPAEFRNALKGMSVTTNAQAFSIPTVQNNSLRVWVGAPTKTVDGIDHNGFYQAEIPDKQLDKWGVNDPVQELNALYKGDPANFTVTNTSDGARIRIENISYSAGFVEIQANPSGGGDGGGGGGGGGGGAPVSSTVTSVEKSAPNKVSATVTNVQPADPVSIDLPRTEAGMAAGGELDAVEFSTSSSAASVEVDVTASTDAPAGTPPVSGTKSVAAMTYFEVSHSISSSRITDATFTFKVSKTRLEQMERTTDDVALYRHTEGEWTELETSVAGETGTHYVFSAVSPGLSVFAIGVKQPSFTVRNATLEPRTISTREPVTITATIDNSGEANGTFQANLTVDGGVIAQRNVTVPANTSRLVTFERTFDQAGTFEIDISGVSAGTLTVEVTPTPTASPTPTTSPSPTATPTTTRTTTAGTPTTPPTQTPAAGTVTTTASPTSVSTGTSTPGQPGFGALAALLALLAVAALARRRR